MTNLNKFYEAKITETRALTRGKASGGAMTRLRCGGLSEEQESLFSEKEEWSIAILSEFGIIPTLFYVKPKHQGKNNQNSVKKRKLEITSPGKRSDICPNFNNELSIFEVVNHYNPDWEVTKNPKEFPSIINEFSTMIFFLEDKYSNRGLILIFNPQRQIPLLSISSTLRNSISYHLAKINSTEDASQFIERWHDYLIKSSEENDIEQKRDDLERLGIQCYFKRKGVDSPASKITLKIEDRTLEFNMDVELKHDLNNFFRKSEASNIKKYPRLPMLIMSNVSTYEPTNPYQEYIHPTISLLELISYYKKTPLAYMAMIESSQGNQKIKLVFQPKGRFENLLQKRLSVSGAIIDELSDDISLGRIKLAKILYLTDTMLDLGLEGNYYREKYGPLDQQWFYQKNYNLEISGEKFEYFKVENIEITNRDDELDETKTRYVSGRNINETKLIFNRLFNEKSEEFQRILNIFKKLDTSRSEIVATLFACWNDKLIKNPKKIPTDDEIINDFRNNWHDNKLKYAPQRLKIALQWMRDNNLIPKGTGRATLFKNKQIPPPQF